MEKKKIPHFSPESGSKTLLQIQPTVPDPYGSGYTTTDRAPIFLEGMSASPQKSVIHECNGLRVELVLRGHQSPPFWSSQILKQGIDHASIIKRLNND
jgi:hypothetical protein